MHVLVTGGTGALGREVVRRLIDEGHRARVLSRKYAEGDDWVQGDLVTGAGLEVAVKNILVVISAAPPPPSPRTYPATHLRSPPPPSSTRPAPPGVPTGYHSTVSPL